MKRNSGKKILVVAESIDVEDSSGSKANVALIYNLVKAGYNVQVCHYTRKNIQLSEIPCFALEENRHSINFYLSRGERYLRYFFKIKLNKTLEEIFGFSFTLINDRNSIVKGLKKLRSFKPDIVLTLSKGGSFRPHQALLRLPEWHSKWLAYIHDPYPMHIYPPPYGWVEPGHKKKWEFVKAISQKAAFSAFPSKILMEWMGSYFNNFKKTGVVIPHQIISYKSKKLTFPTFFNEKKFNLLHAGNLLKQRDPTSLVEAYEKFLQKFPEARKDTKLIFLGNGGHFDNWLSKKNNDNILTINNNLNFEMVLAMQQQASVNIILEADSPISPFLPGKFPHCVAAEKPILLLGPSFSECRRLLDNNYDYWAESWEEKKIQHLIEKLYNLWKKDSSNLNFEYSELEKYLSEDQLQCTMNRILKSL